jgi:two-component system response regulator RegA
MTDHPSYLIVDDDEAFAQVLARTLGRRGCPAAVARDEDSALHQCRLSPPQRVILDLKLEHSSGLNLIAQLKAVAPAVQIVVLTGYSSIPTTVEAIKLGAVNYLCKPASATDIIEAFGSSEGNPDVALPPSPPSVDRLEWEHIQRVLADNGGNISASARILGMHRRTLQRKLQKRPVKT